MKVGFWLVVLPGLWTLAALNSISGMERQGFNVTVSERFILKEVTSCIGALVMVLFVAWWLRVLPPSRRHWMRTLLAQIAGSFLFTLGHFLIYSFLRIIAYEVLYDTSYVWQPSVYWNFVTEYQRDVAPYVGIAAIIWLYRHQQQAPDTPHPREVESEIQRLLVSTGKGETRLEQAEIMYLEADRNYVTVHSDTREYLVRDTLTNLQARLDPDRFRRCHRSFVVNLDSIREVQTADSGTATIHLKASDKVLTLSRSYRDEFLAAFRGQQVPARR